MSENIITAIVLSIAVLSVIVVLAYASEDQRNSAESGQKIAGIRGEQLTSRILSELLDSEDVLLTNVQIAYGDMETEIDNVIINRHGVFIIEVKNYSGTLTGGAYDFNWIRIKCSRGGKLYRNPVKNPIRQVRRQIYILASYIRENGINVWVEGYAYLLRGSSPVKNAYILNNREDMNAAIHLRTSHKILKNTKSEIIELLINT